MSRKRRQEVLHGASKTAEPATKRRREYSKQDAELAKLYDDLSNEVKKVRIEAAASLVKVSSEKDAPVDKILARLIRGLCSNRKAARSGFFVALTEILRDLKPGVNQVIDQITIETVPEGKISGQEKRDYLFGRLFGYKAVIQSSIFFSPGASIEEWIKLLDVMLDLARATPLLREECGISLYATAEQLARQGLSPEYANTLLQKLCDYGLAKSAEGVAIWLGIRDQLPDLRLPHNVWHHDDPLSSKNLSTLAKVLVENNTYGDGENQSNGERVKGTEGKPNGLKSRGGMARSTPSFAWDKIIEYALKRAQQGSQQSDFAAVSEFPKLWNAIVDENLFTASASLERKALGFQLLTRIILKGTPMAFPAVFSKNFMHCLINQRSDPERYLHDAAKAPLDAVRERVKKDPHITTGMLTGLLSQHGDVNLDQITKTKTIDGILAAADNGSLGEAVPLFLKLLLQTDTADGRVAETKRRTLSDHLLSAVRSRGSEWKPEGAQTEPPLCLKQILLLFVRLGYCRPASGGTSVRPIPSVSSASQGMFQSRLLSCLTHNISAGLDETMSLPYYVVSAIHSPAVFIQSVEPIFEADKSIRKVIKRAFKTLSKISTKERSATGHEVAALRAFKLLYPLTILQVYNGDTDAVTILDDIETCYEQVIKNNTEEKDAMKLLMEVLLSFIAKPSVLFRKLAEQVFTAFASELTVDCLEALTDILDKSENVVGQRELFEAGGDTVEDQDEEEDQEGDEEGSLASDVEMIDDESAMSDHETSADDDSEQENGAGSSDDSGDNPASEDNDSSGELDRFNALLAEALQTKQPDAAMPNGEGSSSDEDMDDEQMMALEPHLTKIFQERKKSTRKKHENKDAKETVINFKSRVLDLLAIYVKQQHANPTAMTLILPLLRLVRTSSSKHISEKSFNLLKTYFDSCKGNKGQPAPETDSALLLLESVHNEFMLSSSKMHVSACSRCSLFVVKVLLGVDQSNYAKAAQRYVKTQIQWHEHPRSKMMGSFFTEWISWSIATSRGK